MSIAFKVEKDWLQIPIDNGAPITDVTLRDSESNQVIACFKAGLAQNKPDWYAPFPLSSFVGKELILEPSADILQSDQHWYNSKRSEALRPQFHFTPTVGWNNDPNGLVYFKGEYHLFYQHNPYGVKWNNMHWGHAVSMDLVHWQDLGDALVPDALGTMFSGSAVVDETNACGLGEEPGKPTLVLIYTAAGNPFTQCIASSQDGRVFTKFASNPVVPNFSAGNRDPKVYWHEATGQWIMAFYVTLPDKNHAVRFMGSKDLRKWTELSILPGCLETQFLYECPDYFPLDEQTWAIFGANGRYAIGQFDGHTFYPSRSDLPGFQGDIYAAQTFNNLPGNRRVLIGWLRAEAPGMPFSQAMSIPLELGLVQTAEGPRMTYKPVDELKKLRRGEQSYTLDFLAPGENAYLDNAGRILEIEFACEVLDDAVINAELAGVSVTYDALKAKLDIAGQLFDWPQAAGHRLAGTVFIDRTTVEIVSADGLLYAARAAIPSNDDIDMRVTTGRIANLKTTLYSL